MKVRGSEFRDFMRDESVWNPAWYVDDCPLEGEIDDDRMYDISELGYIGSDDGSKTPTLESAIKKWRKSRSHYSYLIKIPKADVKSVLSMLPKSVSCRKV